jgi:hypothetical protein
MEEQSNVFESLFERVEEYTKTTIELYKLRTVDKVAEVVSTTASRAMAWIFFILFFLMGSLGLALWLGDVLGKAWYGFIIVAAFYGLVGAVIYFILHKPITKSIGNSIIEQLLK